MTLKSLLENRWMARLIVLFTLFSILSLGHTIWVRWSTPKAVVDTSQLDALKTQEKALQQDIQVGEDPFFKEKIVRDELNMSKEGEIILQVPALPTPSPLPTRIPSPTPQVYQEWLNTLSH